MIKVYFSAPSSDLSKDKQHYKKIIKTITNHGDKLISNWIEDDRKLKAKNLFDLTVDEIKQADVVVADITRPSTGVGQQITLAISWKIPVIALKRFDSNHNSRFTLGTDSPYLEIIKYESESLNNKLITALNKVSKDKLIKFNFVTTRDIYEYLDTKSKELGLSKSVLLRKIIKSWMKNNK